MVERLTLFHRESEALSPRHAGASRAVVAVSCACTIAALFVPDLIAGFLSLLRSTLEALFLPFRLLFDLAVWMTTGQSISSAVESVGNASGRAGHGQAVLHCYIPAALVAMGFLLSLTDPGRHSASRLWSSLALLCAASVLIGIPTAALLVPALLALIFTLSAAYSRSQRGTA
ncbi:hypothetical protein [Acetobacter musti]|uniref:hypothetical protein n=1 Tax=Acetobacter musti TaxID=864732 RepID=UPI001F5553B9|nr:hypothetical protein [Acetobacter musti]